MADEGILAIWHNCLAGEEATFEHWYQGEHLRERVSIRGFRFGRRYRGLGGYRDYFTYYDAIEPGVFTSQAYLDRVNDPTPLTSTVMNGIFIDPVRTVCRRQSRVGEIDGAFAVTGVLATVPSATADIEQWLAEVVSSHDGIASAELWLAVAGASDTGSREQKIRGGDGEIPGCVLVTVLRESNAADVAGLMRDLGIEAEQIGVYAQLCELRRESLLSEL